MIFEILAEKNSQDKKVFLYNNETNILCDVEGFIYGKVDEGINEQEELMPESMVEFGYEQHATIFDKNSPLKKSRKIRKLKIQLGLSCNYSCDYCSQKFVGRPPETTKKDINVFLQKLDNLVFDEKTGLSIEFWGGEPFVYWKTMKPLAEALRERFTSWEKQPKFSVVTNGSILNEDICQWLYDMGFYVSISHDGPGQSIRGPDPFEDAESKRVVLDFYKLMRPLGRISFNAMLNAKNRSRKEIHDWFINFTGDPNVILGEGGIVDAYDTDGINNSLITKEDHFEYRRLSFNDIYSNHGYVGFGTIINKIDNFTTSVLEHNPSYTLGQKCGMDDEHVLAIDMRGNVLTCQNVSAVETAMNGESHLVGTLDDYDNVSIKSATHWAKRPDCANCPVLHLCKGACMFLDGEYWKTTCDNAFSDNIALFALSIEKMTGYIPYYINSDILPDDRKDIWGTMLKHEEPRKRKVIPIKAIVETTVVDDIEVYTQARTE